MREELVEVISRKEVLLQELFVEWRTCALIYSGGCFCFVKPKTVVCGPRKPTCHC